MNKECEIIRDLLPLYVDDACSASSREIVGDHLKECADCAAYLEKIRDSFVATLSSSRHGRVSYDTQAQTEEKGPRSETALPVAESATPESRQK